MPRAHPNSTARDRAAGGVIDQAMVSEVMEAQAVSGNPDQVMRAERARVEQEKQMLLGAIRRCHNNAAVKGQSDEEKVNNLLLWGKALNELAHHNSGDEA